MSLHKIDDLRARIEGLKRPPQTVDKERERFQCELDLRELEALREVDLVRRTRNLLAFYRSTGNMKVMLANGRQREMSHAQVFCTTSDIQNLWNLQNEARSLAQASLP